MLYSKTVSEIDLGTHSIITTDGSRLYATGNRFFLPGDIVYTDGTYAYGLQKRRGGSFVPIISAAIPYVFAQGNLDESPGSGGGVF